MDIDHLLAPRDDVDRHAVVASVAEADEAPQGARENQVQGEVAEGHRHDRIERIGIAASGQVAEALAYKFNPIDNAAPIAKARIPILHAVSENDRVVPPAENTYILKPRYEKLGGSFEVISTAKGSAKSNGHHFTHTDPDRIVEFIAKHGVVKTGKEDKDALQGTWVAESGVSMGESIKELEGAVFTFSGDTFKIKPKEGDVVPTGSYKTDNSKSPKQIDMITKGPGGKDMTALSIYKIDGDTLTICAGASSSSTTVNPDGTESEPVITQGPRPTAFDSKKGVMIVLKRRVEKSVARPGKP